MMDTQHRLPNSGMKIWKRIRDVYTKLGNFDAGAHVWCGHPPRKLLLKLCSQICRNALEFWKLHDLREHNLQIYALVREFVSQLNSQASVRLQLA